MNRYVMVVVSLRKTIDFQYVKFNFRLFGCAKSRSDVRFDFVKFALHIHTILRIIARGEKINRFFSKTLTGSAKP
jgi:hypothetical protein